MSDNQFHRKSYHLDVHLTSSAKPIQILTDQILDEISAIKKITNRPRSREALKKVLLNLIHVEFDYGCIRYSRNKNDYSLHKRYGRIWFKYDRLIPIFDGLIELGYVEHINGCWDKEKKTGLQSKIWASEKLINKLAEHYQTFPIDHIERTEPEELIQLKNKEKKLVQYSSLSALNKMRDRLKQYNTFIKDQFITVNLTEPVITNNRFWVDDLLQGLLNGRLTLVSLALNEEIKSLRISDSTSFNINSILSSASSTHPSTSTSTFYPTFSSTPSILSSIILPSTSISTTLLSHIQLLTLLSSTKEKHSKELIDKALSFQNEQLLDYLLNWIIFLNRDIKTIKNEYERRDKLEIQRSLGELGILEFIFRLKYESLHRVFNNRSFKQGGRFTGASHINIPRHMRGFIQINGEPTVELDYDAFHVRMLYHLRGLDIIEDPYDLIEGPEDRDIKKKALLTAINAPTDTLAIKAIRKDLNLAGIKNVDKTDIGLMDLLRRTKQAHPLIADDIGTGKGIFLQNIDSNIADAILTNLMEKNIPALPVHDSFLLPQQFEDELRQQMVDEYKKILNFNPGISKKKKRYQPKK